MSKATLATTAALIAGLGLSAVSYSINAAPASSGDTVLGLYFPTNTLNIGGEIPSRVTLFSLITEMGRFATRHPIEKAADEFVGLPVGFLQLGAGAVLATLWPVSDASTALFISGVYDEPYFSEQSSDAGIARRAALGA